MNGLKETKGLNFRIMIGVIVTAIIGSFVLRVPTTEKLVLITISSLVLSLEVVNTALERYVDSQNPGTNKDVKLLKDMLAGSVLIACITFAVVGVIIFLL